MDVNGNVMDADLSEMMKLNSTIQFHSTMPGRTHLSFNVPRLSIEIEDKGDCWKIRGDIMEETIGTLFNDNETCIMTISNGGPDEILELTDVDHAVTYDTFDTAFTPTTHYRSADLSNNSHDWVDTIASATIISGATNPTANITTGPGSRKYAQITSASEIFEMNIQGINSQTLTGCTIMFVCRDIVYLNGTSGGFIAMGSNSPMFPPPAGGFWWLTGNTNNFTMIQNNGVQTQQNTTITYEPNVRTAGTTRIYTFRWTTNGGSADIAFYEDGVLISNSLSQPWIGDGVAGPTDVVRWASQNTRPESSQMLISEFASFNRALTGAEIKSINNVWQDYFNDTGLIQDNYVLKYNLAVAKWQPAAIITADITDFAVKDRRITGYCYRSAVSAESLGGNGLFTLIYNGNELFELRINQITLNGTDIGGIFRGDTANPDNLGFATVRPTIMITNILEPDLNANFKFYGNTSIFDYVGIAIGINQLRWESGTLSIPLATDSTEYHISFLPDTPGGGYQYYKNASGNSNGRMNITGTTLDLGKGDIFSSLLPTLSGTERYSLY